MYPGTVRLLGRPSTVEACPLPCCCWAEVQSSLEFRKPGRQIYYDVAWGRVAKEDISHCSFDLTLLETKQYVESRSRKVQVHHSHSMVKREDRRKVGS